MSIHVNLIFFYSIITVTPNLYSWSVTYFFKYFFLLVSIFILLYLTLLPSLTVGKFILFFLINLFSRFLLVIFYKLAALGKTISKNSPKIDNLISKIRAPKIKNNKIFLALGLVLHYI